MFGPDVSQQRWMWEGRCRELIEAGEAEQWWWFPDTGQGLEARRLAIPVCESCPVLEQCRDWGLRYEKHGIWGGLSEKQRAARLKGTEYVSRVCTECGVTFETNRFTGGRQQVTCGEECHLARRDRQRAEHDARRGRKNIGAMKALGHGTYSRYVKCKCRCKACRRAARLYQQKAREDVA